MEPIFSAIEQEVRSLFSSDTTGHDFFHLKRVFNIALTIQAKEGGELLVVGASALVHDVHRLMQDESKKYYGPKESLQKVKQILEKAGFPQKLIPNVLHCVEFHEEYSFTKEGKTVSDIETLILQDADNLDAIGAIGVARTFSFGASHGVPFWTPEKPFDRVHYAEAEKDPSTIHHFYSKLLKLKDNFSTPTARKMALKRHKFMETYLKQFFAEWDGKV